MSTAKHTATRLMWCGNGNGDCAIHPDSRLDYTVLATVPGDKTEWAERFVDCVNACAVGGTLHALLTRLASRQMDAAATAQDRVNAADAAVVLRALGG